MGSALLSIGVRAMNAAYAQMQTTSHNIANASVEGYSRQTTLLATAQGQYSGVGFFGRGVNVAGVQRVTDQFLVREATTSKALAAMDQAMSTRLSQMEKVFKTGEQGIGHSISQFFAAMSDLASRPNDAATRSVVLARAQDMALRFNDAGKQLSQLQVDVNQELQSSVTAVNSLAAGIAKVNNDIAAARGMGQQPNDLLDARDRLVSQLSAYVQVSTIEADDGTLGVFMGGGQRLVLGTVAEKLQLVPDTFDGARSAVAITEGASLRTLTTESLGGGSIKGLLTFQNNDLVAAQTMLGQLSRAVAAAVNQQQELGLNLQPPVGSVASQPMFGFIESTKEQAVPASTNQKDVSGNYISEVSIEVVDASQLKATEYELRIDPANPGQWQLLHVPEDGTAPRNVADGDQVDGFVIHFDSGPLAGDRFRLQPVTRAATGMQRLLSDPLDVAAASPFIAATPSTNSGTVKVDALRMVSTPAHPGMGGSVTFTGVDPSDPSRMLYDWQVVDSGGMVMSFGSGTWTPGQSIPKAPDPSINGIELDLSGVPAVGDTLTLSATTQAETNNGNALAMYRLGDLNLVGLTELAGGGLSGGLSFVEGYASAMANVGVRAQSAETAAGISAARSQQAETERSATSGVNLDEEAARLIQFQQSYQAAAKVLKVAQDVFSDLLSIAG